MASNILGNPYEDLETSTPLDHRPCPPSAREPTWPPGRSVTLRRGVRRRHRGAPGRRRPASTTWTTATRSRVGASLRHRAPGRRLGRRSDDPTPGVPDGGVDPVDAAGRVGRIRSTRTGPHGSDGSGRTRQRERRRAVPAPAGGGADRRLSTRVGRLSSWVIRAGSRVDPGGTTPGRGRTDRASSRPSRPADTMKATTVPTAIRREPSVMAVQWKPSLRPGPYSMTPRAPRLVELDHVADQRGMSHRWRIDRSGPAGGGQRCRPSGLGALNGRSSTGAAR